MDLSGPCFSSRGGADVSVQCGSCLSIHTQAHYSRTHRIHGVNSQSGCGALRTPDPCSLSSGPSYNTRPGEVTVPSIASPDRRVRRRRLCPRNPFFHQQPLNKEGRGSGCWDGAEKLLHCHGHLTEEGSPNSACLISPSQIKH